MTGLPKPLRSLLRWAVLLLAVIALGLVMLGWGLARAQQCEEGAFGCQHEQGHDKYQNWKSGAGKSCCNGFDCRPIRAKQSMDGDWLIWIPELRVWLPVPPGALLPPDQFGDGRSHACTSKPGNPMMPVPAIYCFTPGQVRG